MEYYFVVLNCFSRNNYFCKFLIAKCCFSSISKFPRKIFSRAPLKDYYNILLFLWNKDKLVEKIPIKSNFWQGDVEDDVEFCYQIILVTWAHFMRIIWQQWGFYKRFCIFRAFLFDWYIKLTGTISSIIYVIKIHWWIVLDWSRKLNILDLDLLEPRFEIG